MRRLTKLKKNVYGGAIHRSKIFKMLKTIPNIKKKKRN